MTQTAEQRLAARIAVLGLPKCPIDPDNMKRESGPRVQIPFNHHAQGAQRKYRMALAKHRGFGK